MITGAATIGAGLVGTDQLGAPGGGNEAGLFGAAAGGLNGLDVGLKPNGLGPPNDEFTCMKLNEIAY